MKRLELIMCEIDKFSNKTQLEKEQFILNVNDICEFNHNLFLQYSTTKNNKEILEFLNGGFSLI